MEAIRCDIKAYTASFRLPGTMGYQSTSPIPPPSTIFGILSAAAGKEISPVEIDWMAYRFTSISSGTDLEKLIAFSSKGPYYEPKLGGVNSYPVKREFLFQPHLVLYIPPDTVESALLRPRFPICLGRSQDVAYVENISHVNLNEISETKVNGVLIPYPAKGSVPSSAIMSFPTYMRNEIPRTPHTLRLFHVVTKVQDIDTTDLYIEDGEELAVPLYRRDFLMNNSGR